MNRDKVFDAFGEIDDRYVAESARYAPGNADSAPGRDPDSSANTSSMENNRFFRSSLLLSLLLGLLF